MDERNAGTNGGRRKNFVSPFPAVEFVQRLAGLRDGIHSHFRSETRGGQHAVGGDGVMVHRTDEVFAPLLDRAGTAIGLFAINPVEVRLKIAIGTGDVSDFDAEENVATVIGPSRADLLSLIVG